MYAVRHVSNVHFCYVVCYFLYLFLLCSKAALYVSLLIKEYPILFYSYSYSVFYYIQFLGSNTDRQTRGQSLLKPYLLSLSIWSGILGPPWYTCLVRVIQGASTVTVIPSTVREVASLTATTRPLDQAAVQPAPVPAPWDVSSVTRRRSVAHRRHPLVTATTRRAVPLAKNDTLAMKVTRVIITTDI